MTLMTISICFLLVTMVMFVVAMKILDTRFDSLNAVEHRLKVTAENLLMASSRDPATQKSDPFAFAPEIGFDHPTDVVEAPTSVYDGSVRPSWQSPTSYYRRLVDSGFNAMESALAVRGPEFLCPISPEEMYEFGMAWTKQRNCPLNGGRLNGFDQSDIIFMRGSTTEVETLDGKPTFAGRETWVIEALRLIYPNYALPERWRKKDGPFGIEEQKS